MNGFPMRIIPACLAAFLALAPLTALADDTTVVVELFTSQGCSACPPADQMMAELAMRDDIIALSLHVDYWDYLGWADTFASPVFTARQEAYGQVAGSTVVYTPQIVINGADHVVGSRPMDVAELIMEHRQQTPQVDIAVTRSGDDFIIDATAMMPPPRPNMIVQVVSYLPHAQVDIARGENAGRVADYYNVVMSWQQMADWDGTAPFQGLVQPRDDLPLVVIVQRADHGAILGAARLE